MIVWIPLRAVGSTAFRAQGDQKDGQSDACRQHDEKEQSDNGRCHKNGIEGHGALPGSACAPSSVVRIGRRVDHQGFAPCANNATSTLTSTCPSPRLNRLTNSSRHDARMGFVVR